eukprot:9861876-Alexandrium_andersonii.AAC.1
MRGTRSSAPGPGKGRGCFSSGVAPESGPAMAHGLRLPDVGHLVEDEEGVRAAIVGSQEGGTPPEAS